MLAVLHLQLQRTAGAEPAFALERQADALVGAVVHADQTRHLPAAHLADGVQLSDSPKDGVESRFLLRRLRIEDLCLSHQRQFVAGAQCNVVNFSVFIAFPRSHL